MRIAAFCHKKRLALCLNCHTFAAVNRTVTELTIYSTVPCRLKTAAPLVPTA